MEMDIICLSSDDELNSKENIKNKSVVNHTEIVKSSNKIENLSSDDEKMEENNLKRKISQINQREIIHNNTEKKQKLNINQDTSKMTRKTISKPELCFMSDISKTYPVTEPGCITNQDQEVIIERPKLIEKERKKISYIEYDIFPLFISLCFQNIKMNEKKDMEIIVNKLKRRYERLDPVYTSSQNFVSFLNEKRTAIMNNDKRKYLLIEEVMNEMKRNIKKKPKVKSEYDAVPSTSYAANNLKSNNAVESDEDDITINVSSKIKRKIKQVLHAMKKCEGMIKKLEEAEVDFNEENDSNYMKLEKYKQRMVELYNKYCELTGDNIDAERVYLRPKHLNPTRIPVVDHAITNFINSKITQRNKMKKTGALTDDLIFPDYRDILECITRCNDTKNLGLDKRKLEQLAKKAFQELGDHLQRSRQNDYWDTFSLYLDHAKEDPAVKDQALAQKLADNRTEGEKRLTAIFEKYVQRQQEIKEQDNDNETASEEEEEEEEEDEEEEEEEEEEEQEEGEKKEKEKEKEEKKNEEAKESIVDDKNKSQNNLSVISLSDEDVIEKDVGKTTEDTAKTIKENISSVEKEKNNMNIINQYIDISNKTLINESSERSNEKIKTVSIKESDAVSKNETFNDKVHKPSTNDTVDSKIQEDLLPASTMDCTSNVNGTKEDLTEAVTQDALKVMTDNFMKELKKDIAVAMDVENLSKDATEMITGNGPQMIGDENDIIHNEIEIMGRDATDVTIKNTPSGNLSEEEKKPLLRVRSFAKPPTTWKDNQHKDSNEVQKNAPKIINQIEEIIDLTDEMTTKPLTKETKAKKSPIITTNCTIKVGDKVKLIPIVNKRTVIIPSNNVITAPSSNLIAVHNITNVQTITKSYLKVGKRTGQIISPGNIQPQIIRLPSIQANQNQQQNANTVRQEVPLRNETIIQVVPSGKSILSPKKKVVQVTIPVSKQNECSQATTAK